MYGEGELDFVYLIVLINFFGLCVVIINVVSLLILFYCIGIFFLDDWNERFFVVGNGGFGGGINWLDIVSFDFFLL